MSSEKKKLKVRGRCFELTGRFILEAGPNSDIVLVHGWPTLTVEPYHRYQHAWIEVNNQCINLQPLLVVKKEEFYRVGKIDENECICYTFHEAHDKILNSGHWGPWD